MDRWKKGAKEQLPKQVAEFLERPSFSNLGLYAYSARKCDTRTLEAFAGRENGLMSATGWKRPLEQATAIEAKSALNKKCLSIRLTQLLSRRIAQSGYQTFGRMGTLPWVDYCFIIENKQLNSTETSPRVRFFRAVSPDGANNGKILPPFTNGFPWPGAGVYRSELKRQHLVDSIEQRTGKQVRPAVSHRVPVHYPNCSAASPSTSIDVAIRITDHPRLL